MNDESSKYRAAMDLQSVKARYRELAEAAIAYDLAIQVCAGDPDKMSSYCTAQGDTLDSLYARWLGLAMRAAADPAGALADTSQPAEQPRGETTVRYCPECSYLGEVHSDRRDCCPDGSTARYIPEHIAKAAQRDFHASLASQPKAATDAQVGDEVSRLEGELRHAQHDLRMAEREIEALQADLDRAVEAQAVATAGDGVTAKDNEESSGLPSTDREMLVFLKNEFDMCSWSCPRCGWEEDTKTMDAAIALRGYLIHHPSPSAPRVGVPDGWTRALDAAVAAIYFADSSDYETALWQVVKHLKPDLVDLLQSDESAAYEQVKAMLAVAPEVPNG